MGMSKTGSVLKRRVAAAAVFLTLFCFLAIPQFALATVTSSVDENGVLTVTSNAGDKIKIWCSDGKVWVNGYPPGGHGSPGVPCSAITKIIVNGRSGDEETYVTREEFPGLYTGEETGYATGDDGDDTTGVPAGPQCSVAGKVMPLEAKTDGCTVTPDSQICTCGVDEIEFFAGAAEGWEFHEWIPSNRLMCPDSSTAETTDWFALTCLGSSTAETTGWFASILTLAGQSREFLCANDENRTVTVLPFSLTASIADDWEVSLFVFEASGEGNDKKDIAQVTFNYPGGSKTGTFDADNGTITFSIGKILIPAGFTKSFSLVYEFAEMGECCSDCKDFNVAVVQHNAIPLASPGHRLGSANGTAIVGCIWNENQQEGYETIQEAVDDASSGDTIMLCPGIYKENVDVNKPLTIKSFGSYLDTTVQAANANDHVFEVTASNTTIDGLTIQNATGNEKAGIYVSAGDCNILNAVIQNNGKAGIVVMKCGEGLVLKNVKIRNNTGFGIYANENLTINGGNNEISNNGRDGIFVPNGFVHISGSAKVYTNGTKRSPDECLHNRVGGIMAQGEIITGDIEVICNCGHGIFSTSSSIQLGSAKILNNTGFGIYASGNLTINGGNNEISYNGRDGIFVCNGFVHILGSAKVNHNGRKRSPGECLAGRVGGIGAPGKIITGDIEAIGNCGHGIFSRSSIQLGSAKILGNTGFGIYANENLTINGGNNEISNNGRDGIFVCNGFVHISGSVKVNNNGTKRSPGQCLAGLVGGIGAPGKIITGDIEAIGNCGHGIFSTSSSIQLGSAKILGNTGFGICAFGNLTINGGNNEISDNGRGGISVPNGLVTMHNGKVCRNHGYGIYARSVDLVQVEFCENQLGGFVVSE